MCQSTPTLRPILTLRTVKENELHSTYKTGPLEITAQLLYTAYHPKNNSLSRLLIATSKPANLSHAE